MIKRSIWFLARHALLVLAVLAMPMAVNSVLADDGKRGGTLITIVQPEPPILVLGLNIQGPTQTVAGKIYQSLLRFDFGLKPLPGLAESWTISDDGLTYTFNLRKNVKWHDGKPFTSADVVFTTTKMLPETHPRARPVLTKVASVTAPDAHTVVFKLKTPYAPFIGLFETGSCPMMPAHIYEGTDYRKNPKNSTPIGTGPFKFKEWVKGSYIHLVRNDGLLEARETLSRRNLLQGHSRRRVTRSGARIWRSPSHPVEQH